MVGCAGDTSLDPCSGGPPKHAGVGRRCCSPLITASAAWTVSLVRFSVQVNNVWAEGEGD